MNGLFISGTGPGVGKTIASTILLARARVLFARARYHKAIQSGCEDDAGTVSHLLKDPSIASHGPKFKKPLSPHLAAFYDSDYIEMSTVVSFQSKFSDFIIVEGSGGLLVPMNHRYLIIDVIQRLNCPCVIVASTALGTINHTLLSLEALRARRLSPHGVIMMGAKNRDNEESIRNYGKVRNLLALPWMSDVNHDEVMKLIQENKDKIDNFIVGASHG